MSADPALGTVVLHVGGQFRAAGHNGAHGVDVSAAVEHRGGNRHQVVTFRAEVDAKNITVETGGDEVILRRQVRSWAHRLVSRCIRRSIECRPNSAR